jgi:hypothetical protein
MDNGTSFISSSKTTVFEPYISVEDCTRLYLDFTTLIFLQSKILSLVSNPQPRGSVPVLMAHDFQGCGGGILTNLHTGRKLTARFDLVPQSCT